MMELLSPAGSEDSFYRAINCGADAVYLGTNFFNARMKTDNFQISQIKQYIDFAHLYGVRVYITLNTLVDNNELQDALDVAKQCLQSGADALIIQDVGLAKLIKEKLPNAILHASTQMGIHNIEGAKFAEQLGFSRIVLSRETPLEDVKKIKQSCNLEIEFFVQGALCVAFSGNCYLSSVNNSQSGNRGKCLQLCRLCYNAQKAGKTLKSGYFLSAKDMCLINRIKELESAGVDSLKIEGRARRAGYVGAVTDVYRKILDENCNAKNADIEKLKLAFNRGDYCEGYLNHNNDGIIFSNVQGHIGIKAGSVEKINFGKRFNEITINCNKKINKNDTIKILHNSKEECVILASDVKYINENRCVITTTNKCSVGAEVRLIVSSEQEKLVEEKEKLLPIDIYVDAKTNEKLKVRLCYKNLSVECESEFNLQSAQTSPITNDNILQIFNKGIKPFFINNYYINIDNIFIAKSCLNEIRRNIIEKLKNIIIINYKSNIYFNNKNIQNSINNKLLKYGENIIFIDKDADFDLINNNNFDYIAISPENFSNYNYDKIKILKNKYKNSKFILDLPVFLTQKEIDFCDNLIHNYFDGFVANNWAQFNLKKNGDYVVGGAYLNVVNSESKNLMFSLGANAYIMQPENFFDKTDFSDALIATNFSVNLMHFIHCPYKLVCNNDCKNCSYDKTLSYAGDDGVVYSVIRQKVLSCYFNLRKKN